MTAHRDSVPQPARQSPRPQRRGLGSHRLRPGKELSSESRALLRDPPGPLEGAHLLAFTSLRSVVRSTETTPALGRLENEISAMPNETPPVLKNRCRRLARARL